MNTYLNLSDSLGNSISENEALSLIKSEPEAYERFQSFAPNDRKTILEFVQGQRGLKIHILKMRENEGIRLSENASYIIMDILVDILTGSSHF